MAEAVVMVAVADSMAAVSMVVVSMVVVSVMAALVSVTGAWDMTIPTATPATTKRLFAMWPGVAS